MPRGEGVTGAPAGTVVPQELLEEMLWFFRVEDGKWQGTGDGGVGCVLSTQNTNWTLAEALDTVPSSTAGCTFASKQLRGLGTQKGVVEPHSPFPGAWSFIYPPIQSFTSI